jgi:hypothetical protein
MKLSQALLTSIALSLAVLAHSASAEQFPTKLVRVITPFACSFWAATGLGKLTRKVWLLHAATFFPPIGLAA